MLGGAVIALAALFYFIRETNSRDFYTKMMQTSERLALIDQGVSNPSSHLKRNPQMVKAYEDFSAELGIDLRPATKDAVAKPHLHGAALLLLSGRVIASDSHLILAAMDRGIVDPAQIAEVVDEMKANEGVLSDGAL